MKIGGWLEKHGYRDPALQARLFRAVVQSGVANPFAYFAPGSLALERLVADLAAERAADEKAEHRRADIALLGQKAVRGMTRTRQRASTSK